MSGHFLNHAEGIGYEWRSVGFRRQWGIFPIVHWLFTLRQKTPLTWHDNSGYWRPAIMFETDGGSVPPMLRPLLPEEQFPAAYSMHDSAWREGGLWYSATPYGPYTFHALTLWQANRMLVEWVLAEDGGPVVQRLIFAGVTIGALWRRLR